MFGVMFADEIPTDYRGWAATDHDLYDLVAAGMIARGAMPEPDSREPWFICEAHAEGDTIDRVVTIFEQSLDQALDARAREETGKYRLGLAVIRLAQRAERTLDIGRIALPDLEQLARQAHDPAIVAVLAGDRAIVAAQADPPSVTAVPDWTGRRLPLHATAA